MRGSLGGELTRGGLGAIDGSGGGVGVTSISVNGGAAQVGAVALTSIVTSIAGDSFPAQGPNSGGLFTIPVNAYITSITRNGVALVKTAGAVSFTDVASAIAGTGIGVSAATGNVTFTNTGVTSIVAGTGVTISGATGAVTINATAAGTISGAKQVLFADNAGALYKTDASWTYDSVTNIMNITGTGVSGSFTALQMFATDTAATATLQARNSFAGGGNGAIHAYGPTAAGTLGGIAKAGGVDFTAAGTLGKGFFGSTVTNGPVYFVQNAGLAASIQTGQVWLFPQVIQSGATGGVLLQGIGGTDSGIQSSFGGRTTSFTITTAVAGRTTFIMSGGVGTELTNFVTNSTGEFWISTLGQKTVLQNLNQASTVFRNSATTGDIAGAWADATTGSNGYFQVDAAGAIIDKTTFIPRFWVNQGGTQTAKSASQWDGFKVYGGVSLSGATAVTTASGFNSTAFYIPTIASAANVAFSASAWFEGAPSISGGGAFGTGIGASGSYIIATSEGCNFMQRTTINSDVLRVYDAGAVATNVDSRIGFRFDGGGLGTALTNGYLLAVSNSTGLENPLPGQFEIRFSAGTAIYGTSARTGGTKVFETNAQNLGFFGASPVAQQNTGITLTNSVTVGGTLNTIADFSSLTVYATDAPTIRNNFYQLTQKLKLLDDKVRLLGFLSAGP